MHEIVGNAVIVLGDLDMIVEVDQAALPLGILVAFIRQGDQGRTIDLLDCRAGTMAVR